MRTEKQSAASRANGAKSHGPVTPEGKSIIARNAIKHGLTSKAIVLSNEDPALFNQLLHSFLDRFTPADDAEFLLVERMAAAEWRLRRLWSMETAMYDHEMVRQMEMVESTYEEIDETTRAALAHEELSKQRALSNLQQNESRLERQYARALKQLKSLQAERKQSVSPSPSPSPSPSESASIRVHPRPENKNTQNKPGPAPLTTEKEPDNPCPGPSKAA
jgi:hypothetical protein